MSIEELDRCLADLDAQRQSLRAQAQAVAAARVVKLAEEHAALWGLTVEQYAQAKAACEAERAAGKPAALHHHLNRARVKLMQAERAAQSAEAGQAQAGAQTQGL